MSDTTRLQRNAPEDTASLVDGPSPPYRLITTRRDLLTGAIVFVGLTGASAIVGTLSAAVPLERDDEPPTPWFREAYENLTSGRPVEAKRVKVDIPDQVENGNMVPFLVSVDSPMTAVDHVRRITLLSPLNPQAFIGAFSFTPASGAARVLGRLRLAKPQSVLAIAELSSGELVSGSKRVTIHVAGCGAG